MQKIISGGKKERENNKKEKNEKYREIHNKEINIHSILHACLLEHSFVLLTHFPHRYFSWSLTNNHIQKPIHHPLNNCPLIPLPYTSLLSFIPCGQTPWIFRYLILSYHECLKVVDIHTFRPEKIKQGQLLYPKICPPILLFIQPMTWDPSNPIHVSFMCIIYSWLIFANKHHRFKVNC